MKIKTETTILAFDFIAILTSLLSLALVLGYYIPPKQMTIYEIEGFLLTSMTGVTYLIIHSLVDKKE